MKLCNFMYPRKRFLQIPKYRAKLFWVIASLWTVCWALAIELFIGNMDCLVTARDYKYSISLHVTYHIRRVLILWRRNYFNVISFTAKLAMCGNTFSVSGYRPVSSAFAEILVKMLSGKKCIFIRTVWLCMPKGFSLKTFVFRKQIKDWL